jgi:hypothetical protein
VSASGICGGEMKTASPILTGSGSGQISLFLFCAGCIAAERREFLAGWHA